MRPLPQPRAARRGAAARRAAAALGGGDLGRAAGAAARARWRSASSPPRPGWTTRTTALLSLYDDAATVASAALKLLPLDPAVTARWLAELAPSLAGAARAVAARPRAAARAGRGRARARPRPSMPNGGSASLPVDRALRVGVGGPVGSGKSSLIAALCGALADLRVGVVTNDIYTTEDAEFLRSTGVLPDERIAAVQTGGCPHTAIRDDISANLEAVAELEAATGPLDVVFVESGGDNLTAIFSPALADVQVFVIDVAGGDDIPRKGGPGIARADFLAINKTDLAPFVGSDVDRMLAEAAERRGDLPLAAISLRERGAADVAAWVRDRLAAFREHGHLHSSAEGVPHVH